VQSNTTINLGSVNTSDKLAELMLYIAQRKAGDANFGAVLLNKALFYADFAAYLEIGKPITGSSYIRLPQGPAPKALVPVREKLIEARHAALEPRHLPGGRIQQRLVALRDPDLGCFTGMEIKVTEDVLAALKTISAKDVSEQTHDRVWKIASNKEEIPYCTAFLSESPLSDLDISRAQELALEHNWNG